MLNNQPDCASEFIEWYFSQRYQILGKPLLPKFSWAAQQAIGESQGTFFDGIDEAWGVPWEGRYTWELWGELLAGALLHLQLHYILPPPAG